MELFYEVFGGIDFSDRTIQLLALFFVGTIAVVLVGVMLLLRLFLPKSKANDPKALDWAIRRLKRIILFERMMLILCLGTLAGLTALHLLGVADMFEEPLLWVALCASGLCPIFIVAVWGPVRRRGRGRHIGPNQRKLEELQRRRDSLG